MCLEKEPDNRPDCKGLMRHPWFLAQTQGMYKEDDVNDENMDEFEGKVSAETIVQHIVGKRDHEGTGKSGGVVTSSGRIVSSTVRASSGEVALSPRELTRENSTGPSMGASLAAKKQAVSDYKARKVFLIVRGASGRSGLMSCFHEGHCGCRRDHSEVQVP